MTALLELWLGDWSIRVSRSLAVPNKFPSFKCSYQTFTEAAASMVAIPLEWKFPKHNQEPLSIILQ